MCTLRDTVVFLAGAEAMHTLSHVMMHFYMTFPLQVGHWMVSSNMNNWGMIVNGVITVLLLFWAHRLGKKT